MEKRLIRVLLVEDDQDDYILVRDLLASVSDSEYELEWEPNFDDALDLMGRNSYDVCLLDYQLGERNGLEYLEEATQKGYNVPIIFLTGQGSYDIDLGAMAGGAADYLVKAQINAPLLERSIRYALERQQAMEALRKSEQKYRTLVETMNEGLGVQDETGRITYVNDTLCTMLEYSREELIGRPITDLLDEAGRTTLEVELGRQGLSRRISYEIQLLSKSGRKIPTIMSSSPVFDEEGNFRGGIAAVTDIAIRKMAEQKLRESEEKYRQIFEHSPLGIVHFSPEGVITTYNANLLKIVGPSEEQLIGINMFSLASDKEMRAAIQASLSGRPGYFDGFFPKSKGEATPIRAHFTPILSEDARVLGAIGIIEDISEQKRTEDALRESERQLRLLSSRLLTAQEEDHKRMAVELHDSVATALKAVKSDLENTLKQMQEQKVTPKKLQSLISITQHAIEESRRIMTDLRPAILDDLGIVVTIGWFCKQFHKIYPRIHVERQIEVEEDDIPGSLKTVIFRILQEAMSNIARHSKAKLVSISLARRDRVLELTIRDNGTGFDASPPGGRKPRKRPLGLTTMKERTELSGGKLKVESSKGAGTVIKAAWPVQ